MKTKKVSNKSGKVNRKKSTKKKNVDLKNYCKACLEIRKGTYNYHTNAKRKFIPHTCGKSGRELMEFMVQMRIIYGIMGGRNYGDRCNFECEEYYGFDLY